jgi:hypothetical protein
MPKDKYGEDLELFLISLFVKGAIDWFEIPSRLRLKRYIANEKSLEFEVAILSNTFFSLAPLERKEFLVQQIFDAIAPARIQLRKKN